MTKQWILAWSLLLLSSAGMQAANAVEDSVGVKIINGKLYVMHRVDPGESLSLLSRRYGASVASIQEVNKLSGTNIKAGEIYLIPSKRGAAGLSLQNIDKPVETPVIERPEPMAEPPKKHSVSSGESLFAIARQHGVSVAEIKQWNNLENDQIQVGQELYVSAPPNSMNGAGSGTAPTVAAVETEPVVPMRGVHVVKAGETLFGIARTYGMDVQDLKKMNALESSALSAGQQLKVREALPANPEQGEGLMDKLSEVEESPAAADSVAEKESYPELEVLSVPAKIEIPEAAEVEVFKDKYTGKRYKKVKETGKAGLIEDYSTDQTRFYAFHPYLPKGSYIRVDNPERSQSILVEVINGIEPGDPYNLRLSARCMEYLMITEPGTKVVMRYVVPFGE